MTSSPLRAEGRSALGRPPGDGPVVLVACTSCGLVYQLDLSVFASGSTGCPQCGGWTWVAHLVTGEAGGGQP